ncbi:MULTISPECIES: sugar ABC transporter ATP-binding protein [unclassified Mesorhizobium]|uniref:sugar ABC transporter ATP-binding protein n=1 Tax=unclassified Mesorhizobium TaxID=325217 RepID=UPI0011282599|nr:MULTISPECIES: sugar ABC transporter ATP-binding protein [unclassified Mesorhizobium]TPL00772.1 sugar ABC transporter ATP-binding protein [Mesorhizobium sp. B2-4-16]TPL76967.1 sugar ABC transporter ATP-binding protein [Mesorhizobium sp. B2-4-3]
MTDKRILDMNGIGKSFGGVPVLADVHFHLDAGEVVALLGANGAGKSTLMKILSGNYSRDAGTIAVNGSEQDLKSPADALALGIRMLPQELSVFSDLTVAENIMIGALPRNGMHVDRGAMEVRATALLERMGLDWLSPRTRMGTLSHHVQRIVEIARAMNGEARVLIMDEPTASLAADEVQMLFGIIRRLQADGISIIYISHYLKEVFAVSGRIAVLRDGRNAGDFTTANTNVDEVLHAIIGNRVGDLYPAFSVNTASAADVVTVEGLNVEGWLRGVDFTVRQGSITGVHGLIGSGVEMIGRALFGAAPRTRVERVEIDGKPYQVSTPGKAVEAGLGLVAAERKREGIVAMLSLRENMSLANMPLFTKGLSVDRKKEATTTAEWIWRLSIRARNAEQPIGTLSGGNQQKVCLARWLLGDLKVLILEEPTRGVDVGARQEIYRQIRQLADGGLGILLISSDAEEVAGLADRSIALASGRVTEIFEQPTEASALMSAASKSAAAA